MAKENVLEVDKNLLKENEYYLFYEMLMQPLRVDTVKDQVYVALDLLREYFDSGSVVLYKKNRYGQYEFSVADSLTNSVDNITHVVSILNLFPEFHSILDKNKKYYSSLKSFGISDLDNILVIPIEINVYNDTPNEFYVTILNYDNTKDLEPKFYTSLNDTMKTVLKRAAINERNTKAATMDLLTGFDNRNSYKERVETIDLNDENLTVGIFDLFRLKYINDNYNHVVGDKYIVETAEILNKHWPKYLVEQKLDGSEKYIETGHCIYRTGGDEFILITNAEDYSLAMLRGRLAAAEVSKIDLGLGEDILLGLNFGLAHHVPGNSFEQTLAEADEMMKDDKAKTYKKYHLERRR